MPKQYQTREFSLGTVMTIATSRLLTDIHSLMECLDFLTNDAVVTHTIPRFMRECEPYVLKEHPFLADITIPPNMADIASSWLAEQIAIYGETLHLTQIPRDDHNVIDPVDEAISMVGEDRVITLRLEDSEDD